MNSIEGLVTALLASSGLLLYQATKWNRKRQLASDDVQLFPNCLITRFPIVFLDGPQSILYFGKFFNQIPHFLTEHGYEVIELDLPWRDRVARRAELKRFLDVVAEEGVPCHFILSADSQDLLSSLQIMPQSVRSITTMSSDDFPDLITRKTPLFRRLHEFIFTRGTTVDPRVLGLAETKNLKSIGRIYLNHCVRLAESDFQLGAHQNVGHSAGSNFASRTEI